MSLTAMLIAALALLLHEPLCGCATSVPATLMQKIRESSNLTRFAKLLVDTGLHAQLDSSEHCSAGGLATCYLVFAPTDEAFDRSADAVASAVDKIQLARQHIVTVDSGKTLLLSSWPDLDQPSLVGHENVGLGQVRIFKQNSTTVFWQARKTQSGKWVYHVNNAGVNESLSNQEAANGVLHVLNDVALPMSQALTLSELFSRPEDDPVVRQLGVGLSLKAFRSWLSGDLNFKLEFDAKLGGPPGVRTTFLPSDAAWAALPQALQDTANVSVRRAILTAHLAPGVALFTSWLAPDREAIEFAAGGRFFLRGVSVGGVFAGLVSAGSNVALRDAVVHTVDRVLAAQFYGNLSDAAQAKAPEFYRLCQASDACKGLLAEASRSGRSWTLFAPTDVTGLDGVAEREKILALHFVASELIPKYNMTDRLTVSGANDSGTIRFRLSPNFTKLWVEGRLAGRGYVRSELLTSDESTLDGDLLHTIRTPLGWPKMPLREMVDQFPQLSKAAARVKTAPELADGAAAGKVGSTAFVPDNRAMAELTNLLLLRRNASGTSALTDGVLDEMLHSFILPNASILADSLLDGASVVYPTAGKDAENATLSAGYLPNTIDRVLLLDLRRAKLLASAAASASQYQCTDGLLYIVDSVAADVGGQVIVHKPQKIVQKGAVSMTTAAGSVAMLVAIAVGTILSRRFLFG